MRKPLLSVIIFLFFAIFSCLADTLPATPNNTRLRLDTLRVENVGNDQKFKPNDYMPWIVALGIGIFSAVINYLIAKRNREVLERQIESSEKQAVDNIENAKKLAIFEFSKTLNSKNRQDWITDVRESISSLISFAKLLNVEFNEAENRDRRKALMEKLAYYRTKLFLLLNERETFQKSVLSAINGLFNFLDELLHKSSIPAEIQKLNGEFFLHQDKLIEESQKLFDDEWQRIQAIEP